MVAALFAVQAARAQAWEQALPFLVQSICADPAVLPFETACADPRPAQAGATLPWRKFDWGPEMASDAVLATRRGAAVVRHGFDFGNGQRRFGVLDATDGDGGNLIGPRGDDVAILMTQDGTGGVQWLQSPECPDAPEAGLGGWLLFGPNPGPEWRARLVHLRITASATRCPFRYVPSLTRWRRLAVAWPWREGATTPAPFTAQTILSEHYGGASIAGAPHLERFWFAQGLGMVRWERWERAGQTPEAVAARCPAVAGSDAPAAGWRMLDCRMWTRFARGLQPVPNWPASE